MSHVMVQMLTRTPFLSSNIHDNAMTEPPALRIIMSTPRRNAMTDVRDRSRMLQNETSPESNSSSMSPLPFRLDDDGEGEGECDAHMSSPDSPAFAAPQLRQRGAHDIAPRNLMAVCDDMMMTSLLDV